MDVIYPYIKGDDEIIYSLRSLKNIPHNNVYIVGDKPEGINLNKVCYIPFAQTKTKYKNTTEIIKLMCNNSAVSEDFILMNDDFFVLKEIKNPAEELNLYRGNAFKVYDHYVQRFGVNGYSKGMLETAKLLLDLGVKEPLCYELHTPFIFNKSKFLNMFDIKGVADILALHKRSLYGNLYLKGGTSMKDVKIFAFSDTNIDAGQKFVSCSDTAWANLKIYLQNLFNKKSIYEV
ncbi:MAG: hypothetical protein K6E94_06465 [Elusimicrobiaceae bacterium]|nr:hypothetical protein [Elusimicrobiaceae bacterium]